VGDAARATGSGSGDRKKKGGRARPRPKKKMADHHINDASSKNVTKKKK